MVFLENSDKGAVYDYNDYKAYISVIPTNLSISSGSHGIEKPEAHKTFRNACLRIVLWSEEIKM